MSLTSQIRECIERKMDDGFREFIIFPFGDIGLQVKKILNVAYGIQETYILDNHLYKYNPRIKPLSFLEKIDCKNYCLILSCLNENIYAELKSDIKKYLDEENIAEIFSTQNLKGSGGGGNKDR